jgi:hypothetical protein
MKNVLVYRTRKVGQSQPVVFEATAIVDPARTAAMIGSLPEPSGLSLQELKNAATAALARIIASPQAERWRYVDRTLLHLWPLDSEED